LLFSRYEGVHYKVIDGPKVLPNTPAAWRIATIDEKVDLKADITALVISVFWVSGDLLLVLSYEK
jgi:hypothetical protein